MLVIALNVLQSRGCVLITYKEVLQVWSVSFLCVQPHLTN